MTEGTAGRLGRILLVEDHELLAQSLALALRGQGHEVHVVPVSGATAIVERASELGPDVVLLDLNLGAPVGDSIPLIPDLAGTGATVVMLTGVTDRVELARCLEAGAAGVAAKSQSFEELAAVVERALAGEPVMRAGEREQLSAELRAARSDEDARLAPLRSLTRKEAEVLGALLEGLSAEQIAERLYTSLSTVRTHIRGILQKLGVGSQLQAVAVARRAGWEPPARDRQS